MRRDARSAPSSAKSSVAGSGRADRKAQGEQSQQGKIQTEADLHDSDEANNGVKRRSGHTDQGRATTIAELAAETMARSFRSERLQGDESDRAEVPSQSLQMLRAATGTKGMETKECRTARRNL